jgi:glutathione S-transferase
MFLAEKSISVSLVPIDLGAGEQHSDSYRAINSRRIVPTLVLGDGTAIGEVPAIWRYLEETFAEVPLLGTDPKEKAMITMWERRVELDGFAAVMEGVRNAVERLKGRAPSPDLTITGKFRRSSSEASSGSLTSTTTLTSDWRTLSSSPANGFRQLTSRHS